MIHKKSEPPDLKADAHLPAYIFLFGLSGAGKSYCGKVLAERAGYQLHDLDQHLTEAMRGAIREKRSFTDEMRDEFFQIVGDVIEWVVTTTPRAVFTQGAYKQKHRASLRTRFPELRFLCVTASPQLLAERLSTRGDVVTPEYAASIAKNFEVDPEAPVLINDRLSDDELFGRLQQLLRAAS